MRYFDIRLKRVLFHHDGIWQRVMSLMLTDQRLIDIFRMYFSRRGGVGVEGGRRPLRTSWMET